MIVSQTSNDVPVNGFTNWDYSNPHYLYCRFHQDIQYVWKGPGRNLHYISYKPECKCDFEDLMVIPNPED